MIQYSLVQQDITVVLLHVRTPDPVHIYIISPPLSPEMKYSLIVETKIRYDKRLAKQELQLKYCTI
jgi:hypothetical protein